MKLHFFTVLTLVLTNLAWGASGSKNKDSPPKEAFQVASANAKHAFYIDSDTYKGVFIACILDGQNEKVNNGIFHRIHNKFHKLTNDEKENAALIKDIYDDSCLKALRGKKFFDEETCRELRINKYNYCDLPRYIAWLSCVYTPDKTKYIAQVYSSCPKQFPNIKAYDNVDLSNAVKLNKNTLSFSFKGTAITAAIGELKKEYAAQEERRQFLTQLNQNHGRCDCNIL